MSDTFVFNTPADTGSIDNFTSGSDLLQVSAAGFGGELVVGSPVDLVTAADAAGASNPSTDGYWIFDDAGPDAGTVLWDPTGGSGTDATPIVVLIGVTSLLPSDFDVL